MIKTKRYLSWFMVGNGCYHRTLRGQYNQFLMSVKIDNKYVEASNEVL